MQKFRKLSTFFFVVPKIFFVVRKALFKIHVDPGRYNFFTERLPSPIRRIDPSVSNYQN